MINIREKCFSLTLAIFFHVKDHLKYLLVYLCLFPYRFFEVAVTSSNKIEKNKLAQLSLAPCFFPVSQKSHLIFQGVDSSAIGQAQCDIAWVREGESANSHLVLILIYSQ